jgi:hypothetical protein
LDGQPGSVGEVHETHIRGIKLRLVLPGQAHWQQGEKELAQQWYTKAVEWMDKNNPQNEELRRFRAETAALLNIKDASTTKGKEVTPKKE